MGRRSSDVQEGAELAGIGFTNPARAVTNLRLVERNLSAGLRGRLGTLLAQMADPDESLNNLERFLRDAPPSLLRYLDSHPAALHYLLLIFSHSRFLSETLIQQRELVEWLHRPSRAGSGGDRLGRLQLPEDLREELARFRATHFDLPPAVLLARFKRREYLQIMLRDVLGVCTLAETTLELSHLADVILESALATAEQKLTMAFGPPQFTDASGRERRSRTVVLSLGKLGGQELNYSSDIDLLFLYEADGRTAGGESGSVSSAEWFARLAAAALKIIAEPTAEGAVFRVDLRLRPEGAYGDVAVSLEAALRYYRTRAREWELQMLIKARPSAGSGDLGRQFLREVRPLIFRPPDARGRALEQRRGIRRPASASARNVKLSPGGIRDIEFLAQGLQRIYGSGDPWLAASVTGSTLVALQRLHDKGRLSGGDFFRLSAVYQFLRQVEHRLQLRDGLQVHTLPNSPRELDCLARGLSIEGSEGQSPGQMLVARLDREFREVRDIYARVLEQHPWPPAAGESGAGEPVIQLRGHRGFAWPAIAKAALDAGWSRDGNVRRGLGQFLDSALLDPSLVARLEQSPGSVEAVGRLAGRSDLVAAMLARHPEEFDFASDPDPGKIARAFAAADSASDEGSDLDDLRIAARRSVLLLAARSALGRSGPLGTFSALTRLADEVLGRALARLAREGVPGVALEDSPFAVLALGRLGSREMDIGSDADLVFVADERFGAQGREAWRKLAERFVIAVSSHTRHGLLYPVDTRLRPRGGEGEIVQPASYVEAYCRREAAGWEAVAFLKGRPIAGNPRLGHEVLERARSALRERFAAGNGPAVLRTEMAHVRELIEKHRRAEPRRSGLKLAPGGYHDLEYALAYRAIVGGVEAGGTLLERIHLLEAAGQLDSVAASSLAAAVTLFLSVDHALRLATGRAPDFPPDSVAAARVKILLDEWGIPDADRFPEAVAARRADIVSLYQVLVESPAP